MYFKKKFDDEPLGKYASTTDLLIFLHNFHPYSRVLHQNIVIIMDILSMFGMFPVFCDFFPLFNFELETKFVLCLSDIK